MDTGPEHSLAIPRDEFDQVVLERRDTRNCPDSLPSGMPTDDCGLIPAVTPDAASSSCTANVDLESSINVLLRLASAARFFRSADGRLFAQVPVGQPPRDLRAQVDGLP